MERHQSIVKMHINVSVRWWKDINVSMKFCFPTGDRFLMLPLLRFWRRNCMIEFHYYYYIGEKVACKFEWVQKTYVLCFLMPKCQNTFLCVILNELSDMYIQEWYIICFIVYIIIIHNDMNWCSAKRHAYVHVNMKTDFNTITNNYM